MRHRLTTLLLAFTLTLPVAAAGAAPPGPEHSRYRIRLTDGTARVVRGPVERRDGMVVYRNDRGWLVSLQESRVAAIEPVAAGRPAAPAPRRETAPPPAAPSAGPVLRLTNADLPPEAAASETPPSPDEAQPVEVPPVEEPAAPAPLPPPADREADAPPSIPLVEEPVEVAGHPETWWRDEARRLREAIDELKGRENVTYRLWVCAMNDVPLENGKCRPRVNELPPVNARPRTPLQRSLSDQLREIRAGLEDRRAELQRLLDEAIASGAPTAWLLPDS